MAKRPNSNSKLTGQFTRSANSGFVDNTQMRKMEKLLTNITCDGNVATIDAANIRLISSNVRSHPYRARLKADDNTTVEVGIDRPNGLRDFIKFDMQYTELFGDETSIDELTLPAAVGSFMVYYEVRRIGHTPNSGSTATVIHTVTAVLNYETATSVAGVTRAMGRQVGVSTGWSRPSEGNFDVTNDVTPIWRIPIGIFTDPGQDTASWQQLQFDHLNIMVPRTNVTYDESLKRVFFNATNHGLVGQSFNLLVSADTQGGSTISGFDITPGSAKDVLLYSSSGLGTGGESTVWNDTRIVERNAGSRPTSGTHESHYLICTINTEDDGTLISLHDWSMLTGLSFYENY